MRSSSNPFLFKTVEVTMALAYVGICMYSEDSEQVIVKQVYCAECQKDIGSMTMRGVFLAFQWRGELLCVSCRASKCDYCGYMSDTLMDILDHKQMPGVVTRRCYLCTEQNTASPSWWYRSLEGGSERPSCLSSSLLSQKNTEFNDYFQDAKRSLLDDVTEPVAKNCDYLMYEHRRPGEQECGPPHPQAESAGGSSE